MHTQINDFLKRFLHETGPVEGLHVVEIGSYDLNGSAREVLQPGTASYVGVDWRAGPGVDVVSLGHLYEPEPGQDFDVAVNCQALEHDPHWRDTLASLVRLVQDAPSGKGRVIVTCAGPGYVEHELDTAPPRPGHEGEHWYENRSIDDVRNGLAVAALAMGLDYTIEATTDRDGLDVLVWMTVWCKLSGFSTPGHVQRRLGEWYTNHAGVSLEERVRTFGHAYRACASSDFCNALLTSMRPDFWQTTMSRAGEYWRHTSHELRDPDSAIGTVDVVYVCLVAGLVQLDDALLNAWESLGADVARAVRCGLRDREKVAAG